MKNVAMKMAMKARGIGSRLRSRLTNETLATMVVVCLLFGAGGDVSRPNVVVVVLDAARADHFGAYGYGRDTTPAIDAFAKEATRYELVVSEAPYTFLATSSLFSGASPAVTGLGARTGGRVPEGMELIAETAQASGYQTFAYSENPYVTEYFGLAQGFDVFDETYPLTDLRRGKELSPDVDSAARMAAIVDRAVASPDSPFFFYAHLLRPHNPYAPPAPFAGRFGSNPAHRHEGETAHLLEFNRTGAPFDREKLDRLISLYDENLAFADSLFAGLLARLKAAGVLDETIIVLTSDHGEAFGEQGHLLDSTQLFDPMLRVPLIARVPGRPASVDDTPVQLEDLGSGLRDGFLSRNFSGLTDLGERRGMGEPLYSWTNAETHHIAARTETRRLVIDMVSAEVVAYHAITGAVEEAIPFDEEGVSLRAGLLERLAEWTGPVPVASASDELDPEKRRQLESLGYSQP